MVQELKYKIDKYGEYYDISDWLIMNLRNNPDKIAEVLALFMEYVINHTQESHNLLNELIDVVEPGVNWNRIPEDV